MGKEAMVAGDGGSIGGVDLLRGGFLNVWSTPLSNRDLKLGATV